VCVDNNDRVVSSRAFRRRRPLPNRRLFCLLRRRARRFLNWPVNHVYSSYFSPLIHIYMLYSSSFLRARMLCRRECMWLVRSICDGVSPRIQQYVYRTTTTVYTRGHESHNVVFIEQSGRLVRPYIIQFVYPSSVIRRTL